MAVKAVVEALLRDRKLDRTLTSTLPDRLGEDAVAPLESPRWITSSRAGTARRQCCRWRLASRPGLGSGGTFFVRAHERGMGRARCRHAPR